MLIRVLASVLRSSPQSMSKLPGSPTSAGSSQFGRPVADGLRLLVLMA